MKFIVIGITDNPQPWFAPKVLEVIKNGRLFSGGRRHHEIVAPLLPDDSEWIDITAPLDNVFEQYKAHPGCGSLIVFASGDPLFFGFANTIRRMIPDAEMVVYPAFNSLQMLAHRLLMPYHDMRIVSLTGRPWPSFDRALIERVGKIGVLTDREHTPAAIARRMLDYGYTDYTMYVGEHLGNPTKEKVMTLTLKEAADSVFAMPNCLILNTDSNVLNTDSYVLNTNCHELNTNCHELNTNCHELNTNCHELNTNYHELNTNCHELDTNSHEFNMKSAHIINDNSCSIRDNSCSRKKTFGIPDHEFALLDGREKMITKMPIRLLTLQALDLSRRHMFWDIGFCTGSVSVEARLLFPHLQVEAFEIRRECEAIIQENARRHGAPGISVHIGDFLDADLSALPCPDAVFIGGHGGKLKDIMAKVLRYMKPGGIIVMNSVKAPLVRTDSHQLWDDACRELGLQQEPPTRIVLNDHHPIEILKAFFK